MYAYSAWSHAFPHLLSLTLLPCPSKSWQYRSGKNGVAPSQTCADYVTLAPQLIFKVRFHDLDCSKWLRLICPTHTVWVNIGWDPNIRKLSLSTGHTGPARCRLQQCSYRERNQTLLPFYVSPDLLLS